MKKVIFLFTSFLLMSFSASAYDNYNKPFVFLENGIEFAVFKDGQFDFNVLNPVRNYGHVSINTRNINFSFNTGHNYDAFVQYDDYGAVVQIENTTIDYNYYGKVRRIGNIHVYYNNAGLISGIGNLHVTYNNGYVAHCSGYVNNYNINYAFRPHHNYYRVPPVNRCVVYSRPYRRHYVPNRYDYVVYRRNYNNNYYHRPYRARNYYRPGQHVDRRAVATAPRRYNNNRVVSTPRKKVVVRSNTPDRRVYTSRNTSNRTYEPRRTYNNNNNSSRKYVYRKNDVKPNRSYSVNSRQTTTSSKASTRRSSNTDNGNSRSYRRR